MKLTTTMVVSLVFFCSQGARAENTTRAKLDSSPLLFGAHIGAVGVLAGHASSAVDPASTSASATQTEPEPLSPLSRKSRATATALAIGTTLVGWGITLSPFFLDKEGSGDDNLLYGLAWTGLAVSAVGPSVGHFYSGEVRHGVWFSALRGGALGVGAITLWASAVADVYGGESGAATGVFLLGFGTAAGLGLYDWIDAARSVDRYNARMENKSVALLPLISPDGSARLVLSGNF